MRRSIILLVAMLSGTCLIGCNHASDELAATATQPSNKDVLEEKPLSTRKTETRDPFEEAVGRKIDRDGIEWHCIGRAVDANGRVDLMALDYRSGATGVRLVEQVPYPDWHRAHRDSYVISRILEGQVERFDGKWVDDGLSQVFSSDGTLIEATYKNGERAGDELVYFANGKLRRRVPYQRDKREGKGEEWYPSGNLMYWALYRNDVEVDSERFDDVAGDPAK